MTLLALLVVAATVMAAAWALHPSWARSGATADPNGSYLHRFFAHLPLRPRHGNGGNGNGTGSGSTELALDDSPVITPAARDDVDAEDHYLEGFDLRSVARFAVRFFTCVLAALILATFALWILASVFGLVGAFERFMRGIGFTDFSFLSIEFLAGVCLVGAAFAIFMVVLTCVAVALYNVLAYRWEGVRIYVSGPRATSSRSSEGMASSNGRASSSGASAPPPPKRRKVMARGRSRVRS
jgi:transmembrane protein DUF3566